VLAPDYSSQYAGIIAVAQKLAIETADTLRKRRAQSSPSARLWAKDSSLHRGEGRSHLVILVSSERRGQVLSDPVEMLADDPAGIFVARGPVRGLRRRSAGHWQGDSLIRW
jgi:hypothetical protein